MKITTTNTKKFIFIFAVIVVVITISLVIIIVVLSNKNSSSNNAEVMGVTTSKINAYYPVDPPKGFIFDKQTVKETDDVIAYSVDAPNSQQIFLTFQPVPEKSIINTFENEKLLFSQPVAITIGKAVRGQARDNLITSIVTANTWILVTAPQTVDQNLVNEFLNTLVQE